MGHPYDIDSFLPLPASVMHVLVAPLPYLWRLPQLVIWNRDRHKIRNPERRA